MSDTLFVGFTWRHGPCAGGFVLDTLQVLDAKLFMEGMLAII
jgi:hypothetical protein